MNSFELGRTLGRMETTLEDHGRRLSRIEEPRRAPFVLLAWLPYIYAALIVALAVAGKWTVLETIQALKGGG